MTDKKHILIMSSWYPTRVDAFSGNFVERFARLLSQDYDVTVAHTRSENRNDLELADIRNGFRSVIVYHPEKKGLPAKMRMQRKAIRLAFKQVKKPVDLIFAHISWTKGMQFMQAKKYFGAPLLLLEHGSYFRPGQRMSFFQRILVRKCLKSADRIAAVSSVLKKDMLRLFPGFTISIVPNPVDNSVFFPQPLPSEDRLIHISTLDPQTKHPEKILHALRILRERGIDVPLHIVSDQPFHALEQMCEQIGIAGLVTFAGPLGEEEVARELNKSRALVVSSSYETFGIVIAEAWMCGKPVISTAVGIASELDDRTGIQVGGTPEGIAAGIEQFLQSSGRFDEDKLVESGARFSSDNVLQLLMQHINELAG